MKARTSLLAVVVFLGSPWLLSAQIIVPDESGGQSPRDIHPPIRRLPPPARPILPRPIGSYRIRSVELNADVHDQAAKVRLKQNFQNTGSTTLEARFMFPIPDGAAISELTLLYDGKELPGRILNKDDARRIYEEIVRRQRDPALLEYMGQGLYQTSVFPIPPGAERTIEIRYSQLLRRNDGLVDLILPLGTFKHQNHAIDSCDIRVRLETSEAIKTVYSPTHSLTLERPDEHHAVATLALKDVNAPNDVRVLFSTNPGPVGMSLVSFRPTQKEDGYFLLLASPELKVRQSAVVAKTAIIVVDRSGSMSGPKIEQAREAVKFLLRQLKPGDTFNVIAYDSEVESFRPELQRVTENTIHAALGFADGIHAGGGTNIDGALKTSLSMLVDPKQPSYVLFLTDGVPTVGEQNEMKIVESAREADKVHARIFNLGIGYDANSRLLDRLSRELNGQSIYVRPNENIETYVSSLAKSIGAPVLTGVDVRFGFDSPSSDAAAPISRTYPRKLTDLFAGEQLVWVGRYRRPGKVKVTLTGDIAGKKQTFVLAGNLAEHGTLDANAFVEKVWATRRIGELIDEIDLNGKNRELIDELVQLSLKHGILTPYTSFLADEKVDVADSFGLSRQTGEAVSQFNLSTGANAFHLREAKGQLKMATSPAAPAAAAGVRFFDGNKAKAPALHGRRFGESASTGDAAGKPSVTTVGQKTFFWKNDRWRDVDVTADEEKNPIRIKPFSDEYFALASNTKVAKYLALGGPVLFTFDKKTYLVEPAGGE